MTTPFRHAPPVDRRTFLRTSLTAALAFPMLSAGRRPPRILLRSSWQTVNIGDIAHTPGVLTLLERHIPEAEIRLWPSNVGDGVEEMLRKRFPKVAIVLDQQSVRNALEECDFFLHGSGPSLVASKDVDRWHRETHKPFGIYGITLATVSDPQAELLSAARFVFFRDSVSLALAKSKGVHSPVMEFGPDGGFAVDLRNETAATSFLKEHNLAEGQFLCVLSRLRNTPYWKIKENTPFHPAKQARNEEMKEHDHKPLRDAIAAVVRQTPLKILLCPEDASQMAVGKELLYDPLPDDVKHNVVWRSKFWLTDEAISTYTHSAGVFGSEMHSPIMSIGNGVPAIVCRFAEQTSKGLMWRDIGLDDWLFDLDQEPDLPRITPAVLAMATDPAAAKAKTAKARAFVEKRQAETMNVLRQHLNL